MGCVPLRQHATVAVGFADYPALLTNPARGGTHFASYARYVQTAAAS